MCGIAGIYGRSANARTPEIAELATMAALLDHRGPDQLGVYRNARVGLAHSRLSIIDLHSGQQPLANEDHSLFIVFNGEIFNYVELRDELVAAGHAFRTQSDTEVIVHAYEEWGNSAFRRFNGQFAVALFDEKRERLVLARDRLGVRPLYLCEHEGRLYFASEVKAIFGVDASIPRELDPKGLDQTFTFWTVVPPESVFRGVRELVPGIVRTYERGVLHDEPYFHASFPTSNEAHFRGTVEDAAEAVSAALEKATKLRMLRADVPVGSYLSGGLDSSLIATLGLAAKGDKFSTFSLRFEDAEYDETKYQREMVERLGSHHREIVVARSDIARAFPDVIRHTERPILRTAPAPLYLLSKLVRDAGIKVVLTGEGADEMFAGYDIFREAKVRRFWARHPASTLRPLLLERLYPYLARSPVAQRAMTQKFFGKDLSRASEPGFSHRMRWHTTSSLRRLLSRDMSREMDKWNVTNELLGALPRAFSEWTPLAQDQYLEIRTLLSGYLLSSQGDRMLMANSVEGRFPFLDIDVVELAHSLPPHYKLRVLDEKHVLKRVSKGLVPESILTRKKQPYRAPDALSFVGDGAPGWIAEALSEPALRASNVFEPRAVAHLWNKCRAMKDGDQFSNADNMALVGVLSTQILHQTFVRERFAPPRTHELTVRIDRLKKATGRDR